MPTVPTWPTMQVVPIPDRFLSPPSFQPPSGVTLTDVNGRRTTQEWDNLVYDDAKVRPAIKYPMVGVADSTWRSVLAQNHSTQRDLVVLIAHRWPERTDTAVLAFARFGSSPSNGDVQLSLMGAFARILYRMRTLGCTQLLAGLGDATLRKLYVENLPLFVDTTAFV